MGFRFPASWWRAPSWAFLRVGQSALCFLAGRSSKFPQLFAVIQSCRGKYFINLQVSCPLFSCSIELLDSFFSILFIGISYFEWRKFSSVLRYSCKRCVFIYVYSVSLIGCAGSVGISPASRFMYIFRVRISPLCGVAGRYKFIWVLWWCGRRDCTDFLFSLAL